MRKLSKEEFRYTIHDALQASGFVQPGDIHEYDKQLYKLTDILWKELYA